MSLWRNLRVTCPPGADVPETVADMIAALRYTFTLPEVLCSPRQKNFLSMMTTVANRCAASLSQKPEQVSLDAVVASKPRLEAYLKKIGLPRSYAQMHLCYRDKLLRYAHDLQWTCAQYDRQLACHRAWEPVLAALRGDTCGCMSIVDEAEKQLKLPAEVDAAFLSLWRRASTRRSFETEREVEGRFRTKMRQAALASLFPLLDLRILLPSPYTIEVAGAPKSLTDDIEAAVKYKTDKIVKGRPAKERIRPGSEEGIRTALKEVCGIAINVLRLDQINRLSDVFQKDIWLEIIRYLREERGLPASGIRSRLGLLSFLPKTGLLPHGDYTWLLRELNRLRLEPRWRLDQRQRARCISRNELVKVLRESGPIGYKPRHFLHENLPGCITMSCFRPGPSICPGGSARSQIAACFHRRRSTSSMQS